MTSTHTESPFIQKRFREIEEQLRILREKVEKVCKGGPLAFHNTKDSLTEKVRLLESPEAIVGKLEKTMEWMKGAKSDETGQKTVVFQDKHGGEKETLEIVVVGKVFLPRVSEVGGNKKNNLTGNHKDMKEDVMNQGCNIPAFYGKFENTENTQRSVFVVAVEEEMKDFRYMPKENDEVNDILKEFSEVSMRMCENVSHLHNWYGGQVKANQGAMREWVQGNWTLVACSHPELQIKAAKDLNMKNPLHLSGIVECIVISRNIKAMPVGGFFAVPANFPEGRVTTKSYSLRPSTRDRAAVERGWQILGARYFQEWKHGCMAKGMDLKGAETMPELQQDEEGLPVDSVAMWKFMKEHVDYRYVDRILRNIEDNLEVPVPMGRNSSSCFELLGPDLRPVQVNETAQTTRGLSAEEYYAMLAKDLAGTGGVVLSVMEICPRARDIYANLTGMRIIYPSRFMTYLKAPWEIQQNTPKDNAKKINLWIGTDGIKNQIRVMDLAAGAPGKDDVAQLNALTGRRSSLCAPQHSAEGNKRSREVEDNSGSPPTKRLSSPPVSPTHTDVLRMGDDEFA